MMRSGARRVVENLARRAYRRPPHGTGVAAPAETGGAGAEAGRFFGRRGAAQSTSHLDVAEFSVPYRARSGGAARGAYRLNDYELASRLSYFLWSSMPDDELLRVTDRSALRQPGILEAQVKRMLGDPKAGALADDLRPRKWLNLRLLDRKKPDAERFPTVDDELLDSMRRETLLFVSTLIREDRSILESHRRTVYVPERAAWRCTTGSRESTAKIFSASRCRAMSEAGLWTQGSILTLSSYRDADVRRCCAASGYWRRCWATSAAAARPGDVPAVR